MAVRNIRKYGDEILSKKSRDVIKYDDRLHELLDDMAETMYEADGVGLAGVQVGVLRRCAVIDVGEGLIEVINPVIVESKGEQIGMEGCLSCPQEYGITRRPKHVKVKAKDRNGKDIVIEGEDFLAKALCHEIAHLDGEVFKDVAIYMLDNTEIQEYARLQQEQEDEFIKNLISKE